MTAHDVRQGVNRYCVKIIKKDDLHPDVVDEDWNRIKIVCAQPFAPTSRALTFGLSFITLRGKQLGRTPRRSNNNEPSSTSNWPVFAATSERSASLNALKNALGGSPTIEPKIDQNVTSPTLTPKYVSKVGSGLLTPSIRASKLVDKAMSYRKDYNTKAPRKIPATVMPKKIPAPAKEFDFSAEAKRLLCRINFATYDLTKVKYSDFRHHLEKRIGRKLEKEEKKSFVDMINVKFDEFCRNNSTTNQLKTVHNNCTVVDVTNETKRVSPFQPDSGLAQFAKRLKSCDSNSSICSSSTSESNAELIMLMSDDDEDDLETTIDDVTEETPTVSNICPICNQQITLELLNEHCNLCLDRLTYLP